METIYQELKEQKNVRSNLSALRAQLKKDANAQAYAQAETFAEENKSLFWNWLESDDAKSRKNAALLLGEIEYEPAVEKLFTSYQKEQTMFVRSAYLEALAKFDVEPLLPQLKQQLDELLSKERTIENQKHIEEEVRALRRIIIMYEGITHHTFDKKQKKNHVLLLCNRNQRETVASLAGGRPHPLGVMTDTDDLTKLMLVRVFRDVLFPVPVQTLIEPKPEVAAQTIWEPMLALCRKYHKEDAPFYFRVECKSNMTLEERSSFTRKLGAKLEELSGGALINSASDYEVELRLIANREEKFFPCLKFYTLVDVRFQYRKNAISASIHPSTAALIMELTAPYLKADAQIMDPFCGVGTMLIERDIRVPAREKYGTDIFGEAIDKARENASVAGELIHFIHRDFFDFRHEYKFDEIITNMPVRGRMTKEELDHLYKSFFDKALEILQREAVIIMYTQELGFVKKQIRLHTQLHLLQETCMQTKMGFYLLVIGVKR